MEMFLFYTLEYINVYVIISHPAEFTTHFPCNNKTEQIKNAT